MIRYALNCDKDHGFESWFQSAAAFERLQATGMLACSVCGSTKVEKSLMAPTVRLGRKAQAAVPTPKPKPEPPSAPDATRPLATPSTQLEIALRALRAEVEANSEYVGADFAAQARAIHDGDAPERAIYGEARGDEARALIEDGVPVAPLPFTPRRKAN